MGKSKLSIFLAFVLIFTTSNKNLVVASDLVDQTCLKTPFPDLCRSTLSSNPQSKTADVTGLAIIIVTAIRNESLVALSTINTLFKTGSPDIQGPLNKCDESYLNIVTDDVEKVEAALNDKKFLIAQDGINELVSEVEACQSAFAPLKDDPLAGYDQEVRKLALVALAITKTLS